MNLTFWIVRKDFLRLRGGLALWLLVLAAQDALGFSLLFTDGGDGTATLASAEALAHVLAGAGFALTFFLTARLVQEDGLTGTRQFWVTRPISARRLLAAKLLGGGLLLGLPAALMALPWWLTCGFSLEQIAWATVEVLVCQTAVALPAALIASLTDTVSRMLTWSVVMIVATVTLPLVVIQMTAPIRPHREALEGSQMAVAAIGVVGTLLAVVIGQFLQRRWGVALVRLGAGLAVTAVVGLWWPWSRIGTGMSHPSDWRAERAGEAVVKPSRATYRNDPLNQAWKTVNVGFTLEHGPRQSRLAGGWAEQTWRWPDGQNLVRTDDWLGAWDDQHDRRAALDLKTPALDPETERYNLTARSEAAARNIALGRGWMNERRSAGPAGGMASIGLLGSWFNRMEREPPAYEARFHLWLLRPEVLVDQPLAPSGWHAAGGYGVRVAAVRPETARAEESGEQDDPGAKRAVAVTTTMPAFLFDEVRLQLDPWRYFYGPEMAVFNRETGELRQPYFDFYKGGSVTIGAVKIGRSQATVWAPQVRRGNRWVLRYPDWYAGARIALLRYEEEARFTRTVKLDKFELEPEAK
jgi:hypothetical protein